jgi:GTP-binding protein Era
MMHAVDHAVADADVALFMVDVTQAKPADEALERATHALMPGKPVILVLNKMDRIAQEAALPLVEHYLGLRAFADVVPVSARTGWNLDRLLQQLLENVPQGPPYYPKDQLSEHPERFFVAEIVREKVFEQTSDEIPYSTQVNVVVFEERERGKDFIDCEIVVERESQKAIIIGKGGSRLKKIGAAARHDIEAFTGRPVYLQLHVKTRADWRDREGFLRQFGYEG